MYISTTFLSESVNHIKYIMRRINFTAGYFYCVCLVYIHDSEKKTYARKGEERGKPMKERY